MKVKTSIIFIAVLLIGLFVFNKFWGTDGQVNAQNVQLPYDLVCMVNDTYMGEKQIPVPVGEKIYYGCCEMCKVKLRDEEELRYANDPFSGEKVDKADAFIVRKSAQSTEVFYFKNEENYISFNEGAQ